jgi:hypothetical protein
MYLKYLRYRKIISRFSFFIFLFITSNLTAYMYQHTIERYLQRIEGPLLPSRMDCVDCIYVINLEERKEKWNRTKVNFEKQGLSINRFDAINGKKLPLWKRAAVLGPYKIRMGWGGVGCLLSHVSVYKDAYEREFDVVWICEDDIEFKENADVIPSLLEELVYLDPEWDYLYTDNVDIGIGYQDPRTGQSWYDPKHEAVGSNFMKVCGRWRNHSILFSKRGIKKVLDYFTHVYIWSPLDVDIHYIPNLRAYSTSRNIVSLIDDLTIYDTIY